MKFCNAAFRLAMLTATLMPGETASKIVGLGVNIPRIREFIDEDDPADVMTWVCRAASLLDDAELWLEHEHEE